MAKQRVGHRTQKAYDFFIDFNGKKRYLNKRKGMGVGLSQRVRFGRKQPSFRPAGRVPSAFYFTR